MLGRYCMVDVRGCVRWRVMGKCIVGGMRVQHSLTWLNPKSRRLQGSLGTGELGWKRVDLFGAAAAADAVPGSAKTRKSMAVFQWQVVCQARLALDHEAFQARNSSVVRVQFTREILGHEALQARLEETTALAEEASVNR
eukprot:Skav229890  [mRNA]  locus=scaffold247:514525:514944:- [translate_table: standard]